MASSQKELLEQQNCLLAAILEALTSAAEPEPQVNSTDTQLCFEDPAGDVYTQIIERFFEGSTLIDTIISWVYPDGSISDTAPAGPLMPCKDEPIPDYIDVPLCDPNS